MKKITAIAAILLLLTAYMFTPRDNGGAVENLAETPEETAREIIYITQETPPQAAQTRTAATPEPTATPERYYDEASDPTFRGYEYYEHSQEDPVPSPAASEIDEYPYADIEMLAKTIYGEARGCDPDEWRLVLWCIFQRVDSEDINFPDTLAGVITKPLQFTGYRASNPVWEDIAEVCYEEYLKWQLGEQPPTYAPYAPTTPYLFFDGDGLHNWYREEWQR